MAGDKKEQTEAVSKCEYCYHSDKTMRHIHWLKIFKHESRATSQDLYVHLKAQYPERYHAEDKFWREAIETWCHTIRDCYGRMNDENGYEITLWKAWLMNSYPDRVYPRGEGGRDEMTPGFAKKGFAIIDDVLTKRITTEQALDALERLGNEGKVREMVQEKVPF